MDKFTKEQAAAIMAFTGISTMPFSEFAEEVSKKEPSFDGAGTPGLAAHSDRIRELFREDFLAMCR